MSGITVQLVFAFVGTRVPYFMLESATAASSPARSPFGNASLVSFNAAAQPTLRADSARTSPHLTPCIPTNLFTAQGLLSHLAKALEPSLHAAAAPEAATTESASLSPTVPLPFHKPPVFELFDYASLDPLEGSAALHDEQVLLVLCDIATTAQLVEALQLEWLEVYSGAHHPHHRSCSASTLEPAHTTDMAVCTTEEKLRNVAHAQQALCKPVGLHLSLLSKELLSREATLTAQKEQLAQMRSCAAAGTAPAAAPATAIGGDGVSTPMLYGRAASFPLLVELEPSLASEPALSATDATHLQKLEAPLALCEARVRAVESLMQRAAKHHAKLLELAASERATEEAFQSGNVSRACAEYLERTEQDRSAAEAIIADYQVEMTRQVKVVRQLVAYITQVRRLVSKAKYEMGVVELILSRLSLTSLRPRLMEEAEALLRRRVILRRAARRQMLLLQETEFVELQQDLESFSQRMEVQKVLPEKVRWYLRAPLPSLMPEEDPVATLLDHALIDREEDEAQELVEKTRVHMTDSLDPAKNALQITEALLPVERLARRLEEARASAAQYKSRVEELEERLKMYETAEALSPPPLQDSVVKSLSTERPAEGGGSFEEG
ncbi:conserved hypothetical protein [Leishmania infantum JPCM5]|uniref:Uncharacterized protein n=2 Tax=Leishmania infantum TaxID=5671 RepID=A4IDR3_LEIIN|nr:conserved hypothetical protein [Leishmania infantum JPCM5]CAC9552180.1 hypothetical_protein_-_conserved [Leishmania infantum]CAM72996.1 conserved hypothetical protein [Leishmania infantum JPCM5]SUZ46888.1 hypothetical_protein_-_conserved [Leishmania infantum]|eukprot:XP_001469882.1 conserved hypothetical protein [Leishmania infantum JPCM5]